MPVALVDFFLSGGASNSNPDLSLGGAMSSVDINFANPLDNLFDDVTPDLTIDGLIDYRCFYIQNITGSTVLSNVQTTISSQVSGGSDVVLGMDLVNDQQLLTISGTPAWDGTEWVILNVPGWGVSFQASLGNGLSAFASNVQTAMNQISDFNGTTAALSGTSVLVTFSGTPQNHLMPLMEVLTANIQNSAVLAIAKLLDGSPVGVTTGVIATAIQTPAVTFGSQTTYSIGLLRPQEFFPVWVKRTTPPGTLALALDNFVLGFSADYT